MTFAELQAVVGQAFELALWLALPALVAAFVVSLVGSVVQAATAVQDPALGFLPRLLAVAATLAFSGALMTDRLIEHTRKLWQTLP